MDEWGGAIGRAASAEGGRGGEGPTIRILYHLRRGSFVVLGVYAAALFYQIGGFRRILPRRLQGALEAVVAAIRARTEPIGNPSRFAATRRHLLRVYGLVASGVIAWGAGAVLFRKLPHFPIALAIATTGIPAAVVLAIPRRVLPPAGRFFSFYLSLLSAGYAMGPMAWVAQDTLLVFVLFSGFTLLGLCVPLFLTRGMVSYVVSAQVLSAALSLCLVTTPKGRTGFAPFREFKKHAGMQLILNGDVNVLLTLQLAMNMGICVLHTLPTIHRFISWKGSLAELEASTDALKEAACICAAWNYLAYRFVRSLVRFLIRYVLGKHVTDSRPRGRGSWLRMSDSTGLMSVTNVSGAASGFVMLLGYVRVVSLLQRGDLEATLERVRGICAKYSPIGVLLDSNSAFVADSAMPNKTEETHSFLFSA
ncbi:unnamed protein product [Phytomonas sp. EM1]|nr:unnamed protein product [Phytomonas sp. EM1]|eukprot:CCW60906.1 unnamed protein product [Phytomonas sp. isolate EM1]